MISRYERPIDRLIYSIDKLSKHPDLYRHLYARSRYLSDSLRYYYKMLCHLDAIDEGEISRKYDVSYDHFKQLLDVKATGIFDYFGNLSFLYGEAYLEGTISPREEQRYIRAGEKTGYQVQKLFLDSFHDPAAASAYLKSSFDEWKSKDDISPPNDMVLNPWNYDLEVDLVDKLFNHRLFGLSRRPQEFYTEFLHEMKPLFTELIKDSNDIFVVGNVASGVPDAGIITAALKKMFPKKRISMALSRHSPIKELDKGANLFPYEKRMGELAKKLEAVVFVVDHIAHSGGSVYTYLHMPEIFGEKVFCFISDSAERIGHTTGVQKIYYNHDNNIGIYCGDK